MGLQKFNVIIVGAGIAGMTAGIYVKRAGFSVLIIEKMVHGGQIINTLNIENWPGDYGVSGADLSEKIYNQVSDLGVELRYEEVEEISGAAGKKGFMIKTDENEYSCDVVILATGTEPRKLSKKQAADAGERPISYCATCDGALYKGKSVVVVGSGNTAKHEIRYLEKIASEVYHIHHDDPIPKEAAAVFVAIGRKPNTKFLQGLVDVNSEGYVVAGEDCKTSRPGVFVAGDCRTKSVRQLVTAAGDGAVAAQAALDYLK